MSWGNFIMQIGFVLGICGGCLAAELARLEPHLSIKQLPPPPDTPGQYAPVPNQEPQSKKEADGLKQLPEDLEKPNVDREVRPEGRNQQDFIVVGNVTFYFDRTKKGAKNGLKREKIEKQQGNIKDVEYEEYCQDFNFLDS